MLITVITMHKYHFHKANYMKQKSIVIASCLVANFPQAHEKGMSRRERKRGKKCIYINMVACVCVWVKEKRNLKSMSKLWIAIVIELLLFCEMTMMFGKNKLISIGIIRENIENENMCTVCVHFYVYVVCIVHKWEHVVNFARMVHGYRAKRLQEMKTRQATHE